MVSRVGIWIAGVVLAGVTVGGMSAQEGAKLTEGERKGLEAEAKRLLGEAQRLEAAKDDASAALHYQKAAEAFEKLGDQAQQVLATFSLGKAFFRLGRQKEAIPYLVSAATLFDARREAVNAAWMQDWLGACYRDLKDDENAVKHYSEAVKRFEALDHREGLSLNLSYLGRALVRLGRFQEAIARFQRAEEIFEGQRKAIDAAWMCDWIGLCHESMKDDKTALAHYSEGLRRFTDLKFDAGIAEESADVGKALKRLGKFQDALPHLKASAEAYERTQNELQTAWMYDSIGSGHEWLKDTPSAILAYEEGLRRFQKLKLDQGIAVESESLAKCLWQEAQRLDQEGKVKEAVTAGEKVLAANRTCPAGFADLSSVLEWLAERYERPEDFAKVRSVGQEAHDTKTRLLGKDHWQVTDARLALAHVDVLARLTGDQRQQLASADRRNREAVRLYREGTYQDALRAAGEAIDIRKGILGETHPHYATSLNNLVFLYDSMGDYSRSEPLHRQTLEIRKNALGETHPYYAQSLNNLAGLYRSMGVYARAEPLYLKALDIRKSSLGETHAEYAEGLNNLGALYESMGDFARAELHYRQAKEIRQKALGEAHPDYAVSLNNLALLYRRMGDFARAEPLNRQALDIRKRALGEAHPTYAEALNNLGALYESMGDYARAEPLYRQALEIWKMALGESHPLYATSLNNLAALYGSIGDDARAEPLYQQAFEIRKTTLGEAHPDYATSLTSLAAFYESKDDARAERLYQQALEIKRLALGEGHPDHAISLSNLAGFYRSLGDYSKAEPRYREALSIRKKALGETHPDYARSQHNLASLCGLMGDYTQAEPRARQALAISKKYLDLAAIVQSERQQILMAADLRDCFDSYLTLATRSGKFAGQAYENWLAWKGMVLARQQAMRAATDRPELAPVLEDLRMTARRLATLSFATPAPAQAAAWRTQMAELSQRKEALEAKLSAASSEYRKATQPVTVETLHSALPAQGALVDFVEYWHSAPKAKEQGVRVKWEQRLAAFVVRRDKDVRLADLGIVAPIYQAVATWRKDQGASTESKRAAQTLREKLWAPVENMLTDGTAGLTTPRLVLISPDGELGKFPFGALPGRGPGKYLMEDMAIAMLPVPQAIVTSAGTSLPAGKPGKLLVLGGIDYDHRQSAERSAGAAVQVDHESQASGEIPRSASHSRAPRDGAGRLFSALAGAQLEMAAIGSLYQQSHAGMEPKKMEGALASQEAFVRAAPDYHYLHLATHGYFAAEHFKSAMNRSLHEQRLGATEFASKQTLSGYHPGLLSGLALAGANEPTDEDDGILTAEELGSLNLSKVDLVTLSACETGLGDTAGGEGLLGLQRAFQMAGAKTVVASLWSVPDQATKALMARFYENLWNRKLGKLEALREAQLWMLREGAEQPEIRREIEARGLVVAEETGDRKQGTRNTRLPPYYWGAWVLSGDWR